MPKQSNRSARGRAYPGHPIEESFNLLELVHQRLGDGPFSRAAIAEAMGQALSGSSMVKIGAMSHYGFVDQRGGVYHISDLGRSILFPRSDDERQQAIVHAVRSPALYAELFDRFGGKPVPGLLSNILHRELGVQAKAATRCADIFLKSATFAGLLKNGVLHLQPGPAPKVYEPDEPISAPQITSVDAHRPAPIDSAGASRVFAMPLTGQRIVSLSVPARLTSRDFELMGKWLQLMEGALVDDESSDVGDVDEELKTASVRRRTPR
jgi:hypothetical protein